MGQRINLGDSVKCNVSGITGVAMSRTEYLYSSTRVGVQRVGADALDKDGAFREYMYFDEMQLDVVPKAETAA